MQALRAQEWLVAYHTAAPLNDSRLYAGPIQQAVILEVQHARIGAVDIRALGRDGQLPVLDLPQLAAFYARSAGLHPFAEVPDPSAHAIKELS